MYDNLRMDVSAVPVGSRRGIRRAVTLPCELISNRADHPVGCRATDLSTTGLWLATAEPVRAGDHVVVCFEPSEGWHAGELSVFAEVTRVVTTRAGGGGMGLEFMDLEAGEQALLDRWLSERKMPVPRRRRPVPRAPLVPPEPCVFRPAGVWR